MAAPVITGFRWPQIGKLLILALAYFAGAHLGLAFPTQHSHITLFWLPSGIAVAALLRWGRSCCLLGIFAGALLTELSLGTYFPLAVGSAAGNTLAALITVLLLKHWRFDPSFTRQRDLFALIAASSLGMTLSASVGTATLWLDGLVQTSDAPLAWLNWWLGDTVGVILAGPLFLSLTHASRSNLLRRPAEAIVCGFLLCTAGALVFIADYGEHSLPLAFLPLPLVLWAALRQGVTGASLAVLALSLLTAIGTALGKGVFGAMPAETGMYLAWLYMFTVALTGLMVTTILGERQQTALSLQRANELLTLAQREAKAGVWDWDLISGKLTWSDELFLMYGLDPKTSDASLDTWSNVIHPADRQSAKDKISEAARDGNPLFYEYRIESPNGGTKWILAIGNTGRNERNEATRMSGLCIDVTAQKDAQQRLQHSESRYKALLQQAADALFVHDFEGRIVEVNQQACDTLGYSSEELCRMRLPDISPEFDLTKKRAVWELLQPGQPICFISSHRRKDGSIFPVEVRLVSLALDNVRLIMALASDITERQRIESALQESEARYRNFAEQLPLGIVITQDGLIRYVNQASTEMIGYSEAELLDKPFLPLVYEADRTWLQDLHQRRMQGEKVMSPYVVRMTRKDGQVRQWEMHASTIEWKGRVSGFGITADITDRIILEEKLRNSLRQLEEKELSKTRFLAAAGHDLRQPIAAANLFVDALKLTSSTDRQRALLERLEESMSVFSSLLERLLDISKFDAGLIKPKFTTFSLSELFNWLELNFAHIAREKGLDFRLYFPMNRALVVRTDIGLLQSVMMNLVSNAIKFTSRGGILVSARLRNNSVLLQVWDTGSGIAGSDLPFIFEEFYQGNNPQRSREAGLGLGLSICQRAMSLLGKTVTCRSRHGHGSVFEFELPLNGERRQIGHMPTEGGTSDKISEKSLLHGKRVVALEDDALVASGLRNLLEELGAEVLHFLSAEDALQHTSITHADLFIVDFALSGKLSGIDFLTTVQQGIHTPIKAVVITGETSSGFITNTRNIPWPVLHKPVNLAKLLSSLNQQANP